MRFLPKLFPRRWLKDESGAVVVDFAIMLPVFLMLMLSSVEMGMMTFRQTMLERGLDMAVRNLRLGLYSSPTHAKMKDEMDTTSIERYTMIRSIAETMRNMPKTIMEINV